MSEHENEDAKNHREDLFRHTLGMLRYGEMEKELTDALAECISRAQTSGKVTELTLKIKIKPRQNTGQYLIEDDITTKLPKRLKEETLLFGTPDGNLQREDPRQRSFDLRDVSTPSAPVKVREAGEDKPKSIKAV